MTHASTQQQGSAAPAVSRQSIDAMVASLRYTTNLIDGTTATLATALLPCGYVVATGMSACVSPANFNRERGMDLAIENARALAREKLWELEGYALMRELRVAALESSQPQSGKTFGWALSELKKGRRVERAAWAGGGMWLELQTPDPRSKMTHPYIYLSRLPSVGFPEGSRVPWAATQADMLADDWRNL